MKQEVVDISATHGADVKRHIIGDFSCYMNRKRGLFYLCTSCLLRYMCITGHDSDGVREIYDNLIQEAHHLGKYKIIET